MKKISWFFLSAIFFVLSSAAFGQDVQWLRIGHGGEIDYIDFSPDGRHISSSGFEHLFKIWDIDTKKLDYIISCENGAVLMDYSLSGDTLFIIQNAGNKNGYIFSAWDPSSSLFLYSRYLPDTNDYGNREITAVSNTGNTMVINYWNRKNRQSYIVSRDMLSSNVDTLAIVPDQIIYYLKEDHTNHNLFSLGDDSVLRIWDIKTRVLKQTINAVRWDSYNVSEFSNAVLLKNKDSTISAIDIQTGNLISIFPKKISYPKVSIIPAPDTSLAVVVPYNGMNPIVINFLSGQKIADLPTFTSYVARVIFSKDGKHLAVGLDNGELLLLNTKTWTVSDTLTLPSFRVGCFAFDNNNEMLCGGTSRSTLRFTLDGNVVGSLDNTPSDYVTSLSFSPSEKYLAISGSNSHILRIDSDIALTIPYPPGGIKVNLFNLNNVQFTDDSSFIYTVELTDEYGYSHEYLLNCGEIRNGSINGIESPISNYNLGQAILIPGSAYIAATDTVYGPTCGGDAHTVGLTSFRGSGSVFNTDGTKMLTVLSDSIFLWDVNTGLLIKSYAGIDSSIWGPIGFSNNGMYFFTAGHNDSSIRVWDVASGVNTKTYKPYLLNPSVARLTPDGQHIVVGYEDGTILMLDISKALSVGQKDGFAKYRQAIIFPNPFSDKTSIELPDEFSKGIVQLSLYNILGLEVMGEQFEQGEHSIVIDRKNLPAGVYQYRISNIAGELLDGELVIN
jgi:WD40 repeat protein